MLRGLNEAGVDEPNVADRLSLVTSELVTNAVLHAGTDLEVSLVIDGAEVWLEVTDHASGLPDRTRSEATGTSGRGLVLVDAVVDDWGVAATEDGLGKKVWARLSRIPTG